MMYQSADYWASTELYRNGAWFVSSYDGNTGGYNKNFSFTVRAAVAFTFNL